ncbi:MULTISPECIES: acetyl-CoA carboxylase biotin carboxyl carrier protein [unclassified Pantoea]|uniref:acetyl-CoA carboxylase biotin carboxyl carrier protein n=1 Tax=unclassified Pantoea TaxID=2630326 RepID=UPI001CD201C1|nr:MULTISPECIES: biotin/lipoyl-containing protein [unclassified Pantoea]MCA1176864.1 acetyl-CoA carboxylase biotin carboxyl carrier protein subunit [Pantoea sp. alder69]MCA1251316.1 acetyl-CoA carboxylase biotin carboxyl carrier protein subunit [Pantoea sp. alder70]MCA1265535.1 acetyl-CoA carboxylase biotin carboxyl carrier protein subunit [Pantoea sp. alder81]
MEKTAIPLPTLRALARKMQRSGLNSLALEGKQWSVRLTFAPAPALPVMPTEETPPITQVIGAPLPGTLLRRHPHSQQDFVQPGQQVAPRDLLALVQVGPLYVPVLSPIKGRVQQLRVKAYSAVEYDEELLTIQMDN